MMNRQESTRWDTGKKTQSFKTDCYAETYRDACWWIIHCDEKDSDDFGFNCSLYSGNANYTDTTRISNYSRLLDKELVANCSFTSMADKNGQLSFKLSCEPSSDYINQTRATSIQYSTTANSSSVDGKAHVFKTDCWGNKELDQCFFIASCSPQSHTYWYNCLVYGNSDGRKINPNVESYSRHNYTRDGRLTGFDCNLTRLISWTGNRTTEVSCKPASDYSYKTSDLQLTRDTLWNYQGRSFNAKVFYSDCWGNSWSGECYWVTVCVPFKDSSFGGWDCLVYDSTPGSQGKETTESRFFSNYSYPTGELMASCTATNTSYSNGSVVSSIACKPAPGYNFKSLDYSMHEQSVYNWSSIDGKSIVFSTDCWGRWFDDQCHFIASCAKSYTSFGYVCLVYGKQKSSPDDSKCFSSVHTNHFGEPDWCANCTTCNFTAIDGSARSNVTCRPCRNYSYATTDYSVHPHNYSNPRSDDSIERRFTSDCGSFGCGWCASALKDWYGLTVSRCDSSETSNTTRTAFKFELGYGIDWCANCSVNASRSGSRFGGCNPCSSWAPYTNLTCESNITQVAVPGLRWCSNCTTCSNGFQFCRPCIDAAAASLLKSLKAVSRQASAVNKPETVHASRFSFKHFVTEPDSEPARKKDI